MTVAQNVLVVTLDDVGMADVASLQAEVIPTSSAYPRTPVIDAMKAAGVWFRNHWVQPSCSPTRGTWWTARHPFRTGAEVVIQPDALDGFISQNESFLFERIKNSVPDDINCSLFGKWHVTDDSEASGGENAPELAGADKSYWQRGNIGGLNTYNSWEAIEDGVNLGFITDYNTTKLVDECIAHVNSLASTQRWHAQLHFAAPHSPYHEPPIGLTTFDAADTPVNGYGFANLPDSDEWPAMLEALDTELGRLFGVSGLDLAGGSNGWTYANTLVIVCSDNGTPGVWTQPPVGISQPSKGFTSWSGTCVPMIARGAGVTGTDRMITHPVSSCDLGPTVIHALGGNPADMGETTIDGVSWLPLSSDPAANPTRDYAWAERRSAGVADRYGIASGRYHVIRTIDEGVAAVGFYDTVLDPQEATNLLDAPLTQPQQEIFTRLVRKMDRLIAIGNDRARKEEPVSVRFDE